MNVPVVALRHSSLGLQTLESIRPMFSPDTAPEDSAISIQAGLDGLDKLAKEGSDDEKLVASVVRKLVGQPQPSDTLAVWCLSTTVAELADNVRERETGQPGLSVTLGQVLAEIGKSAYRCFGRSEGSSPSMERVNNFQLALLQAIGDHARMPSERLVARVAVAVADADKTDHYGRFYTAGATFSQLAQWNNPVLAPEFPLARIGSRTGDAAFMQAIASNADSPAVRERAQAFVAVGRPDSREAYAYLTHLGAQARA